MASLKLVTPTVVSSMNQTLVDTLPEIIFWRDGNGALLGVNRAFCSYFNIKNKQHVLGKQIADLDISANDADMLLDKDEDAYASSEEINSIVVSLLRADGTIKKFHVTKRWVAEDGMLLSIYRESSVQMKEREKHAQMMRINQRFTEIVSGFHALGERNLFDELAALCRSGLVELSLDRVGVWQLEQQDELVCAVMIDSIMRYDRYITFQRATSPDIFDWLQENKSLTITDVHKAEQLSSIADSYFIPNDIHALLMFPIILRGKVWGFVTFEKQKQSYIWSEFEELFAQSLAQVMALSITTSENTRIRAELEQKNELFDLLMASTQDGIWDWDIASNALFMSPRWFEMLGYKNNAGVGTIATFMNLLHIDDMRSVYKTMEQHRDRQQSKEPHIIESKFRIRAADGTYRWVMSRGATIYDAQGKAVRVVGTATDIHSIKMAEENLLQQQEQLQKLVELKTYDLKVAKDYAEAANLAKSEFLSNMSHELRTPLHAVMSYSAMGMQKADALDAEKHKKYYRNINVSGERLLVLINDLLDLSQMEAKKMVFDFTEAALLPSIQNVQHLLQSHMDEKAIAFVIENHLKEDKVRVDIRRVEQALMNIISNAVKYTPQGGNVSVVLRDTAQDDGSEWIAVDIVDEGCGIPEGEIEYIFEIFSQSSHTKTGAGGKGLGLPLSRQIMQAHGGKISVKNNSDKGSCFTLLFPVISQDGNNH